MDYIINEYSLQGHFSSVDSFFQSLREYTIPVLKKIEEEKDSVIWKSNTLWKQEVCDGITLSDSSHAKNHRNAEVANLKRRLIQLYWEEPFLSDSDQNEVQIIDYSFDQDYCCNFQEPTCFTKALEMEGRIISFEHDRYKTPKLNVLVKKGDICYNDAIDNIFSLDWWIKQPEIKHWYIDSKYYIEVRAKEFTFHPPHFHVSYKGYEAVYTLRNCELYRDRGTGKPNQFDRRVKEWFVESSDGVKHADELRQAWDALHEPAFTK